MAAATHKNTLVVICGRTNKIPEVPEFLAQLGYSGYCCATASNFHSVVEGLNGTVELRRLVLLVHYPSFVTSRVDAHSYQQLLLNYSELKACLLKLNIESHLILFSYRDAGPLLGGWGYPITAYALQDSSILLAAVQGAIDGSLKEDRKERA